MRYVRVIGRSGKKGYLMDQNEPIREVAKMYTFWQLLFSLNIYTDYYELR